MGGWKTILLLKIFLFFYVHIRVCFAEQMSFYINQFNFYIINSIFFSNISINFIIISSLEKFL